MSAFTLHIRHDNGPGEQKHFPGTEYAEGYVDCLLRCAVISFREHQRLTELIEAWEEQSIQDRIARSSQTAEGTDEH